MRKRQGSYKIGFSPFGVIAFVLQELPYIPWLLNPPGDNPLSGNDPANVLLGVLEQAGGIMTIVLLILVVQKAGRPKARPGLLMMAGGCLAVYYVCWAFYFAGYTNGWLIVLGLSAVVPLYYFFVAMWLQNPFAAVTSILFLIGHTGSNTVNFLLA